MLFKANTNAWYSYAIDLMLYIAIMFLIRETHIPNTHFLVSGFLYSGTTLVVATWMLYRRGLSWSSVGLRRPKSIQKTILKSALIFLSIIATLILFNMFKEVTGIIKTSPPEVKATNTGFSLSNGDYAYVFSILGFVWLQSALEELLERGFLITWLEGLMVKVPYKTSIAIVIQAAIWGFRHSYDLSERSISVFLIGILMGVAYVKFNRNLWPVIVTHCVLNTLPML